MKWLGCHGNMIFPQEPWLHYHIAFSHFITGEGVCNRADEVTRDKAGFV